MDFFIRINDDFNLKRFYTSCTELFNQNDRVQQRNIVKIPSSSEKTTTQTDDLWNENVPAVIWDVHRNRCIFHSCVFTFLFISFCILNWLKGAVLGIIHLHLLKFTSKNHMLAQRERKIMTEREQEKERSRARPNDWKLNIDEYTKIHCHIYSIGRVLIFDGVSFKKRTIRRWTILFSCIEFYAIITKIFVLNSLNKIQFKLLLLVVNLCPCTT